MDAQMSGWEWLVHSEGGLLLRIGIGVAVLAVLAWVDLRRHGAKARRWREYLFLVACVGIALAYGVVNDQLTVGMSWEYFYYGKDLMTVLGPQAPPDEMALRWEALKVGLKATWTAGLVLGVILLMANNPARGVPALGFGLLFGYLPLLLGITVACAAVLGLMGWMGWLTWLNSDFEMLLTEEMWRPYRFMAVYGIHLGGYVGGLVGAAVVAVLIRRERRRSVSGAPVAPLPTDRLPS